MGGPAFVAAADDAAADAIAFAVQGAMSDGSFACRNQSAESMATLKMQTLRQFAGGEWRATRASRN
jgi:hypothetical protein